MSADIMSDKVRDEETEGKADTPEPRLCSEIQLFDLCDLSACDRKNGRFCTDDGLLSRFERISEKDECAQILCGEEDDEDGEDHLLNDFDPEDGDDLEE